MQYGHFDDANREYVITRPDTPFPWINYLGNDDFFSLVSNTAGGYSFFKDAKLRRITRYRYNNVPVDNGGKYFYINDNGHVWSPGWKPVKTKLDNYECRHGMSYTRIKGESNGLEAEVLYFVPLNFWGEVQKVKLTNTGKETKKFKLFSFVEWCLWNALDDQTNFQRNFSTGEVEIEGSAIYHKTEYKERRNHFAFYSVNAPIAGYDTDRDSFIGLYNDFDKPDVVFAGQSKNTEAHGWGPIASHCIEVELKPGEVKELVFVLGYVENEQEKKFAQHPIINKEKAYAMQKQFATAADVNKAFDALKKHWDDLFANYTVNSKDEKLNRMMNTWNPYQNIITYNFSRSASFFESGIGRGMGFRDSNQDLIGSMHMIQAKARERILDLAATQLESGGAYHQYQPLTKKGNSEIGGNFNDDPMWLIFSTAAYIKETGDWSILDVMSPYNNDESKAQPLLDHLRRSFYHVVNNLGVHGLPLIGRADWNDCLNLNCFSNNPDESFQTTENQEGGKAESVMIAGLFVLYGRDYVDILKRLGKDKDAQEAQQHIDNMIAAIDKNAWDGEWFLRAYDHFGKKIGSNECEEGKIFIESNGFCTMAGIGKEDGRAQKALDAVKERLDCTYGIVLNNPAFTKYYIEMGEISTYPAGYKENAGIFCHNNPWIMIGETVIGRGDQAFEYYSKIAPAYLENIQELHKMEPYVYAQMVAGKDAFKPGEAKNSWLTGTAAWNYFAISQHILGIKPSWDGLMIDPCIPKAWDGYDVIRKYRGAIYKISIKNPNHISKGIAKLTVNGKEVSGNVIPVASAGSENNVEVVMG